MWLRPDHSGKLFELSRDPFCDLPDGPRLVGTNEEHRRVDVALSPHRVGILMQLGEVHEFCREVSAMKLWRRRR